MMANRITPPSDSRATAYPAYRPTFSIPVNGRVIVVGRTDVEVLSEVVLDDETVVVGAVDDVVVLSVVVVELVVVVVDVVVVEVLVVEEVLVVDVLVVVSSVVVVSGVNPLHTIQCETSWPLVEYGVPASGWSKTKFSVPAFSSNNSQWSPNQARLKGFKVTVTGSVKTP